MSGRLAGKIAVVSGGAGGCGRAASVLFASEGAKIGIVDLPGSDGEALATTLREAGHEAVFAAADVSDEAAVTAAVGMVSDALGPITVLFNHAGTLIVKPFLDTTAEEWDRLMAINVRSMFLMTRAVLPQMIAAGGGSIVCTSSISAVAATPGEVLYDTTKGACHMFARAIAVEYRDRNIRCNAVCPGFIRTAHGERELDLLSGIGVDVSEAAIAAQQGRMCRPEEVAQAALFLVGPEASFISGAHLFVDNCFTSI
ncbi:putative oxidoreductase [Acidiphilium multivorum AIU301]|uniref:Putative oxidoreductase n=1 Tax=Acidiphilium multivorum (strain DSM 11245 / JCM 8867 / NBRC 100883 / AIU 301) TaxID=926570 RepID=F0IZX1_ACIMA|nr:SDR family oxidoreductase [Acidiphilium multivorum]BAJ81331.1 putative oxidoreductase [Acidiphilium multivorum AIU301]GAN73496.1 oxidoreductase/short-chain dehydrogenase/reductase SDR [Acidiphilium multivorum AIU301]